MEKQALIEAIGRSGGKQNALDEVDVLWDKIDYLQQTGRFGPLLSQLVKANDKSNFLALVLEVNFAYQFEVRGLEMFYEVKQNSQKKSSVDFLHIATGGDSVFFELRLLQQAKPITDWINKQLKKIKAYSVVRGGQFEQDQVLRIQNTILNKVQDKHGKPIKFFSTAANVCNIVVIDASDSIFGAIDIYDCMLATYGDPSVQEVYKRQVFGLFQEDNSRYPQNIHKLATKYVHIRTTLHGVLFLFKKFNTGILAYQLEQYLMWNPTCIDETKAQRIFADITRAIPCYSPQ